MRRVIEKLAYEREQKEDEFSKKLQELKKKTQETFPLQKLPDNIEKYFIEIKKLIHSLIELIELQTALSDTKDREWDALGSNHVGMIFKSMEWRVDQLAAEYGDAKLVMKKFISLKEKLNQLLSTLEEKKMPSPPRVKELLEPLEDWRYAGFENRFRGYEEEVKRQQSDFLPYFKKNGLVLDLGCGRGEFLELLRENGIEAEGIDINDEMVEICRDKGLNCLKGDLLDKLAEQEDGSLGGLFSSQVVEHLRPQYLSRLVELAYFKLASSAPLILETINPTSVFSLVQIYLLDLSHQNPIHPQTLKFLMESAGFERIEVTYSSPLENEKLQELPAGHDLAAILNQNIDKLNSLLYAPANYAVIGFKP
jgi:SAM-dependent methyltransferase